MISSWNLDFEEISETIRRTKEHFTVEFLHALTLFALVILFYESAERGCSSAFWAASTSFEIS
jgi:hypothetical protein